MFNFGCANGSLVGEANYPSPVPVIGIYIAAASFGGSLLIVCDVIFAGILPRKRLLPCNWFALNSVTLTLLSVATKLTVDLTSPMPSRWDQLSKLTGTAFICITMGFMVPSIGVNAESECFTNMMALTIFVITVTVNICIQLYTGVIFMFFVEHIILLGLMMLLLLMLWLISFEIKKIKRIDAGYVHTSFIAEGSRSMFERLKLCYVHAYCSNPQLKISMFPMTLAVGSLCAACTAVTIEAAFRSLILNKLEFCEGVSDYSWSMRYIVIFQILTVLLGCISIVFRGVAMFWRMNFNQVLEPFTLRDHEKEMNRTLKAKGITLHRLLNLFGYTLTRIVLIAQAFIVAPWSLLYRCFPIGSADDVETERFVGVVFVVAKRYGVRKSIDDMIRLMEQVSGSNPVYQPLLYLSQRPPSSHLSRNSMEIHGEFLAIEISALSMALLVKMAEASISKSLLETLVNTFEEAKEVIEYIYKARQARDVENRPESENQELGRESESPVSWRAAIREPWLESEKWAYARAVWIGGDLRCMLPAGHAEPSTDPRVAIDTMEKLKEILRYGDVWKELGRVIDFINRKRYLSIESLCEEIEQVFADMLHALFARLPIAIFHSITESTRSEDFEESVRVAMKLLFKIQSFQYQDDWAFHAGMTDIDQSPRNIHNWEDESSQFKRLKDVVLVCGDRMALPNIPLCEDVVLDCEDDSEEEYDED